MTGVLCFFHCPSNTGYAIQRHEYVFTEVARRLTGDWKDVHLAYTNIDNGCSNAIPSGLKNIIRLDFETNDLKELRAIEQYIRDNNISIAIGFDQPVYRASYKFMRRGGVTKFMSYWGAPMSDINSGLKLLLKKLQVKLTRFKPDLFAFQSQGMRKTAVLGRGIDFKSTYVIRSGVNVSNYTPDFDLKNDYAHTTLGICRSKKLIIYSGHMEKRKGVHIVVESAVKLITDFGRSDVHFIIFGNRPGEEKAFDKIYKGTEAEPYITFGGYRQDLPLIQPCCYTAVLATTGWDSFPMSTIEVSASGVPLIVSDLLGVRETVLNGITGLRFKTGDSSDMAEKLNILLDNPSIRHKMALAARIRAETKCSRHQQVERFLRAIECI